MPFDDPLAGRRDHEEEYFRKHDRELIEKLRRASGAAVARRELGEKTGLKDPELLKDIEQLGFDAGTVSLLPLMPLLQVAWAEGGVSGPERALLVAFARQRGIAAGDAADRQLQRWLETCPADSVFAQANRLIHALLAANGAKDVRAGDIVEQCEAIAAASGGVLGFGKVSEEERTALAQIAAALKQR